MAPSTLTVLKTTLLSILLILPTVQARQPPTSFCKCICFTNSTIIPLNSSITTTTTSKQEQQLLPLQLLPREDSTSTSTSTSSDSTATIAATTSTPPEKRLTCADCTKAFCLDQNLPICAGAKDEEVFTTCFQRDSLKDETIVLLFIILTAGLLGWAVLKPWVDKIRGSETVQRYTPVGVSSRFSGGGRSESELPAYRDDRQRRHRATDSGGSESFARQGGLNS